MATETNITSQAPLSRIDEIGKHEGQAVEIRGWLYNLRESGKLLFPQFRDGSGIIQGVVAKNQVAPEVFDAIKGLTQESSVIVRGKVRADKRAPGGYELDVENVDIIASIDEEIARLKSVRQLLAGSGSTKASPKSRTSKPGRKRRRLSAEARKKIADAQRLRWAKQKKASQKG